MKDLFLAGCMGPPPQQESAQASGRRDSTSSVVVSESCFCFITDCLAPFSSLSMLPDLRLPT